LSQATSARSTCQDCQLHPLPPTFRLVFRPGITDTQRHIIRRSQRNAVEYSILFDQLRQLHAEIWFDYLLCAPLSHSSCLMFTEKVLSRLLWWFWLTALHVLWAGGIYQKDSSCSG